MEQSHIKELLELCNDIELTELQVTKAVSKFNDCLVRDLKFLANMVGFFCCQHGWHAKLRWQEVLILSWHG
jgi:hypothetical protein